jgi:hypothetical protein
MQLPCQSQNRTIFTVFQQISSFSSKYSGYKANITAHQKPNHAALDQKAKPPFHQFLSKTACSAGTNKNANKIDLMNS